MRYTSMFFFHVFLIINLLYAGKTQLMPELADRAGPNAGRNRLAVLLVVALLQALVLRAVPEAVLPVLAGLVRVAEGIGLFLRGGATGGDRGPGVRLRPTLVRDLVALGVGFTAASDPRA